MIALVKSCEYGFMALWVVTALMMLGLYMVIAKDNLIKRVMGLNIFQASVIMFVAMGKVNGANAPIWPSTLSGHYEDQVSNPLPHVLMLTAIVVGIATTGRARSRGSKQ